MKESEMNCIDPAWQHAKAGYEYTHFLMNLGDHPEGESHSFLTNTGKNPVELDEKLLLKETSAPAIFKHNGTLQDSGHPNAWIQAAHNDTCSVPGRQV